MPRINLMKHFRAATAFNPVKRRWPVALKAGAAMFLLLGGSYALGFRDVAMLVSLGTSVVLYGHDTAAAHRMKLLGAVALAMTVSATIGAVVGPIVWLWVISLALSGSLLTFMIVTLQVGPPGAFFILFAQGVAGNAAIGGTSPTTIFMAVGTGAFISALIGMVDLTWDPTGPERRAVLTAGEATQAFAKSLGKVVNAESVDEESPEWNDLVQKRHRATLSIHHAWTTVTDGTNVLKFADDLADIERRYLRLNNRTLNFITGLDGSSLELVAIDASTTIDDAHLHSDDRSRRREARRNATEQIRETATGRPSPIRLIMRALRQHSEERFVAKRVLIGTLLAGFVALALGSDHVYWAATFATLLLNRGGTRDAQIVRIVQRLVGTAVGLGLFGVMEIIDLRGWALIIVIPLLQAVVELLVVRNYAVAVAFITPMALTLAERATGGNETDILVFDRFADTLIATIFAIFALYAVGYGRRVTTMRSYARNVVEGIEEVLVDIAGFRHETPKGREHRKMLYYALLQSHEVASYALADEPEAAEEYVDMEDTLSNLGYLVLSMAWHPDLRNARDLAADCRDPLDRILRHPIDSVRPANEIHDDVRDLYDRVQTWRP